MRRLTLSLLVLLSILCHAPGFAQRGGRQSILRPFPPDRSARTVSVVTPGRRADSPRAAIAIPPYVRQTLEYIERTGNPPPGYQGGRQFMNDGRGRGQVLPRTDARGNPVTYREYDVRPFRPGVNRGAQRLVRASDGSAYYTADHYRTFIQIK